MPEPTMAALDGRTMLTEGFVRSATGLSRHTLIRMRKLPDAGGLPFVRLSTRRIGYLRNDVEAFLAVRRVGAVRAAA